MTDDTPLETGEADAIPISPDYAQVVSAIDTEGRTAPPVQVADYRCGYCGVSEGQNHLLGCTLARHADEPFISAPPDCRIVHGWKVEVKNDVRVPDTFPDGSFEFGPGLLYINQKPSSVKLGKREHGHYFRPCPYDSIDIYRVLSIFEVADPCIQHAVKKLLVAGGRGHKDIGKDIKEAIDSLVRWQEMREEEKLNECDT